MPTKDDHIVFFDGYCHLCQASVQFVLQRDSKGIFSFAPLQGKFAAENGIYPKESKADKSSTDSIVLWQGGKVYYKSSAAIRIASKLKFPWPLFYIFLIIPAPIRNLVYDFVARNRYTWFGKSDACIMPAAGWQERFLE
ncbi:MAG: thiol-disulfide oxidoreductase DCC family protein [Cyclobacteriaceae bacterium]